jgi:amino acid permease
MFLHTHSMHKVYTSVTAPLGAVALVLTLSVLTYLPASTSTKKIFPVLDNTKGSLPIMVVGATCVSIIEPLMKIQT